MITILKGKENSVKKDDKIKSKNLHSNVRSYIKWLWPNEELIYKNAYKNIKIELGKLITKL